MNFDQAFAVLLDDKHEGGYTDLASDPGNWTGGQPGQGVLKGTKYGISAKSYPGEDIKNLSVARAKEIYLADFWGPAGCDMLPDIVKFEMFDLAVNTSAPKRPTTAIKILQRAIGADPDGVIGKQTIMLAQSFEPNRLLRRLQASRIRYYTSLNPATFANFGRGWMNRIATNMEAA